MTFSYHTSTNNHYTIGISISGDLSKREMTSAERQCLYARLLTYLSIFPNLTIDNILGHKEYPDNATACPCTDMNRIRSDIRDLKLKMEGSSTIEAKRGRAYDVSQQTRYLYSMIGKNDGNEQWALSYFEKFYSLMKAEGWFK